MRLRNDIKIQSWHDNFFEQAYGYPRTKHRKNYAAMATTFINLDGPGRVSQISEHTESGSGTNAMQYGWGQSPVGPALVAWDEQGIRSLALAATNKRTSLNELATAYPAARLISSQSQAAALLGAAFEGHCPMPLSLEGTAFQCAVWRALIRLPFGERVTYAELAQRLGRPTAARAVGNALAANRIGFLVPCHRVVQATGAIGQFRWGSQTKAALLAWERESLMSKALVVDQN